VLEHARRREPPAGSPALALRRQVTAGDSQLTFYAPAGLQVPAVPAD
jgi:hypothetical protein